MNYKMKTQKCRKRFLKKAFLFLVLFLLISSTYSLIKPTIVHTQSNHSKILKTATYGWRPFIFKDSFRGTWIYSGLDLNLAKKAFEKVNVEVEVVKEMAWGDLLNDLKEGKMDIVISALRKETREEFAYYSEVFRSSVNVLYVKKGNASKYDLDSVDEMLNMFKQSSFKLGVVDGYSYGKKEVDDYVRDPLNASKIVKAPNDESLFSFIERGYIDGFLIDQIVGADISYKKKLQNIAEEYPLPISELPYYVIFSKKTTDPALVEDFNEGLRLMRRTGEYNRMVQEYLFPVLLGYTTGQPWFFFVEILGVICFSLSGVILASKEGYDLFGALLLAALPGIGGGIVRDLISGREQLGIMIAPLYLIAVFMTVLICYIFILLKSNIRGLKIPVFKKLNEKIEAIPYNIGIEILDALGLSTLSIIGVIVALETKCSPLWIWGPMLASITSAGGGILRDVVRGDKNNPGMKGEFYPEIAIIWGFIFSYFLIWYSGRLNYFPNEIFIAVMVVIFGSFITRLLAIIFRWKTPLYYAKGIKKQQNSIHMTIQPNERIHISILK